MGFLILLSFLCFIWFLISKESYELKRETKKLEAIAEKINEDKINPIEISL